MKRIEHASADPNAGRKPLLSDAFGRGIVKDGESHEVEMVKETGSRGGYMVHTKLFAVLTWKGSDECEALLAEIERLISLNPSEALYIVVSEKEDKGMFFAVDDTQCRMWSKQKKFGESLRYLAKDVPPSGKRLKV